MSWPFQYQLKEFLRRYGKRAALRLMLAPLTSLVATPWRHWQLWQTFRQAGSRRWAPAQELDNYKGLLSYAYHTQALAISRHGRSGQCPYLGQGNYPMSAWWHITWPSLALYWRSTSITTAAAMLIWWLSGAVWLDQGPARLAVMALLAASSSLYGQAFLRQNYNALGWMFWPLGLWATMEHHHHLATVLWLGASFFSFTSVFCAAVVLGLYSCCTFNPWPLLTVLPAIGKLCTHLLDNLWQGNIVKRLTTTAKAIGLQKTKAPLAPSHPLGTRALYYVTLYSLFGLLSWSNPSFWLYGAAYLVFLVNFKKRFADEQSLELLMLSVASALTFQHWSWVQLAALWLVSCPELLVTKTQQTPISMPSRKY